MIISRFIFLFGHCLLIVGMSFACRRCRYVSELILSAQRPTMLAQGDVKVCKTHGCAPPGQVSVYCGATADMLSVGLTHPPLYAKEYTFGMKHTQISQKYCTDCQCP